MVIHLNDFHRKQVSCPYPQLLSGCPIHWFRNVLKCSEWVLNDLVGRNAEMASSCSQVLGTASSQQGRLAYVSRNRMNGHLEINQKKLKSQIPPQDLASFGVYFGCQMVPLPGGLAVAPKLWKTSGSWTSCWKMNLSRRWCWDRGFVQMMYVYV